MQCADLGADLAYLWAPSSFSHGGAIGRNPLVFDADAVAEAIWPTLHMNSTWGR
jgi:hypothetical protein